MEEKQELRLRKRLLLTLESCGFSDTPIRDKLIANLLLLFDEMVDRWDDAGDNQPWLDEFDKWKEESGEGWKKEKEEQLKKKWQEREELIKKYAEELHEEYKKRFRETWFGKWALTSWDKNTDKQKQELEKSRWLRRLNFFLPGFGIIPLPKDLEIKYEKLPEMREQEKEIQDREERELEEEYDKKCEGMKKELEDKYYDKEREWLKDEIDKILSSCQIENETKKELLIKLSDLFVTEDHKRVDELNSI